MFSVNIILALGLLIVGAMVNRAAMKSAPQAGRSFLVPLSIAKLLVLCGLVMTAVDLVQARAFIHW
jgi:hypothetical protein